MQVDRFASELVDVPRGLAGVAVADTEISDVNGREGYYQYREYSATALAERSSFEEVWHLLVLGELPTPAELDAFRARIAEAGVLPAPVVDGIRALATGVGEHGSAITLLKATLPIAGAALGLAPLYDVDPVQRRDHAIRLAALAPRILAEAHRALHGSTAPESLAGRGVVANYLAAITGRAPSAAEERALSAYLIAVMDHGFNASTFTARVIASTGADLASCLAGALGALTGPLHGGAPSRVLDVLDRFEGPDAIEPWIRGELAAGRRLMGFGHAVYRTTDPRSELLKRVALGLGGPRVELALGFEAIAERVLAEVKPGRGLHANVEFYASVVMEACGVPREMFTATFAAARVVGWTAHCLEQAADPKIIRPAARYVGPPLAV